MRALRRTDHAPRLELMPLIDVIFLLLTFFIYNLLISAPLEKLPVRFTDVATGERASGPITSVTLDQRGDFFWGKDRVTTDELDRRLAEFAVNADDAPLYLVVDAVGDKDRAPLLIGLIERVKNAGVKNMIFVGQPSKSGGEGDNNP